MNPLSLDDIASQFYISSGYLCKTFKDITNFTIIEYINYTRVKEAKKLLKTTNTKVADIAMNVGFGSITHFGRIFKQITGNAPLYYRKNENIFP